MIRLFLIYIFVVCDILLADTPSPPPENPGYLSQKYKEDIKNIVKDEKKKKAIIKDLKVSNDIKGKGKSYIKAPSFLLRNVSIKGGTIFKKNKIISIVKPFVGKRVTSKDLKYIASSITNLYKKNGYITSSCIIPKQKVINGNVRFEIIENLLGKIAITGDNVYEYNTNFFYKFFQDLIGKPINVNKLNDRLKRLNYLPVAVIKPSLTRVNKKITNLILQIKESKEKTSIVFDNYGSYYTGENRLTISTTKNNLFGKGDRLFLTSTISSNIQYYNAFSTQFSHIVGKDGGRFSWSASALSYQLDPQKVGTDLVLYKGGSTAFGSIYSRPLFWFDRVSLSYFLGFEHKRLKAQTIDNRSGDVLVDGKEKYSVLSLGSSIGFIDSLKGFNRFSISIKKALPSVLDAMTQNDIRYKGYGINLSGVIKYGDNIKADFVKYYADYTHKHNLPYKIGSSFSISGEYVGYRIPRGYEYKSGDYGYSYSASFDRNFWHNIISGSLSYSNSTVYTYDEKLDTSKSTSQGLGSSIKFSYKDFFFKVSYSRSLDDWDSNKNNYKFSGGFSF